ncbi:MAG TPA: hypothetical protein VHA53_05275 [Nitrolancea sp.]|nr:hypothetical protein [Nitrolancea sp.]
MLDMIRVSLDDAEDSPVTGSRDTVYVPHSSELRSSLWSPVATTTSGTAIVFYYAADVQEYQIVDDALLEDEFDLREALDALAEAREKGTISHADLKAKLGLA